MTLWRSAGGSGEGMVVSLFVLQSPFVSINIYSTAQARKTIMKDGQQQLGPLLIEVNGVYYRRVDRRFSQWGLLPLDERRARMREYMRMYRKKRKRKEQLKQ